MALKVFNYTNDKYIEGVDTRAQVAALLRNNGYGFRGSITRVGGSNTYTVAAGSVIFVGGLCVRVLSDEAFDLTTNPYIVVETTHSSLTDGYTCTLKGVTSIDVSLQGNIKKHFAIYDKNVGVLGLLKNIEEGFTWKDLKGQ